MGWMKSRLKVKFVAFFAVVPILIVTALVTVPCPVCDGTGSINSTPNTDKVSILEMDSQEQMATRYVCGAYIIYKYDVVIKLLNEGSENAVGWLKMVLVNPLQAEGRNILDTQYVQMDVPAKTVLSTTYTVVFGSGLDLPHTEVRAEVVVGNVPDTTCNGTGRIPMNASPFVNGLKDTFKDIVRVEQAYKPPVSIDWEDYVSTFRNW